MFRLLSLLQSCILHGETFCNLTILRVKSKKDVMYKSQWVLMCSACMPCLSCTLPFLHLTFCTATIHY